MLSSSLSFQAGVAPTSAVSRSAVSMQVGAMQGVGTANMAGGVVPTRGRYDGFDSAILVQGGSLRTWSYRSPLVEQVQVVLSTEGELNSAAVPASLCLSHCRKSASSWL